MATLSVSSTTDSSIRVKLSGLDSSYSGDRYYYWYIDGGLDGESSSSGSTTSKSYTFSGLEPDTEYYIQCSVQWWTDDGEGDEQWSRFSVYGTTDPYEYDCYYDVTNITTDSITIKVSALESGFTVRFYVIDNETEEYVVDKAYTATGSTMTKTFTGLSPGTEYRVNVEIDNTYLCGTEYHTTLLPDYSFDLLLPTADTVGVEVYEVSAGDTVRIYIREGGASATSGTVVHDKLYTADGDPFTVEGISGLTPGTKYTANVSINGGDWLGGQEFTTGSVSVDLDNITATTVDVTVSGTYDGAIIHIEIQDADGNVVDEYSDISTGGDITRGFVGLTPGTDYFVVVYYNEAEFHDEAFTTLANARPDAWEWWSVVEKGAEIQLSAAEWNAFTACINDFRVYKDLAEYSFTTAVSGKTAISAAIVNQARTAIAAISGHGTLPAAAVQGDPVTAAFFNDLRDALNTVP